MAGRPQAGTPAAVDDGRAVYWSAMFRHDIVDRRVVSAIFRHAFGSPFANPMDF
jgi:hypothetical protein